MHGVNVAPAARHQCDLSDQAAIDRLVTALPGELDALVNCAGLPGGDDPVQVFAVNFLGLRHLTESLLGRTQAVVHVGSVVGNGWPAHAGALRELMDGGSFDAGLKWAAANPDLLGSGYPLFKEAFQYYTAWRAPQTIRQGDRMNCVCPGVTDTPMLPVFQAADAGGFIDRMIQMGNGRAARRRRSRRRWRSWRRPRRRT